MALEIVKFRAYKKNSLLGFFSCKLTAIGLELRDCALYEKEGDRWIGLPSKPYKDEDGNQKWAYIIKFYDKNKFQQFQKCALHALDEYVAKHKLVQDKSVEDNQNGNIPF